MALLNNIAASRRNFSPLSLAPALWLSDTGSDPAQWDDISGNNRHATQAEKNQPDIITNALNGRQVRRFNGTNDTMIHGLTGNIASCSIFAVFKMLSTQSGYRGIIAIGPAGVNGSMLLSRVNSSKWGTYTGSNAPANSDVSSTQFKIHCIIDNSGAGGLFYLNGLADGIYTGNSHGQTAAHVGGDPSVSQRSNCDIAEILVFPTALSPENRRKVEKYLSDKWAITIPTVDEFYVQSLAPALWLDASDPNTLFDAVSGGNLVGVNGPVARWEDKSGNGRHATQSTLANQPLRKTSVLNGRDGVYADGNDVLASSTFSTASWVNGSTIISVLSVGFTNTTAYRPLVRIEPNNPNAIQHEASTDPSPSKLESFVQNTANTLFRATPTSVTTQGVKLLTSVVSQSLSSITLFDRGLTTGGPTSLSGTIKTGTDTLRVFGEVATGRWLGHAFEILAFPYPLSTTQRQNVEQYLSNKWNFSFYDPDAVAYFNRIAAAGSSITDANKLAVSNFVTGCKADNIWPAIKACCLLAGPDTLSGALVPLVGPAPINYNFVSADYSRTTGLSGSNFAAGKRLNPQRFSGADPQNDSSLSVWVTNASQLADLEVLIGAGSGTQFGTTHIRNRGVGGGLIEFRNRSGAGSSTSDWTKTGFLGMNRNSQSQFTARFNSTNANITNESTSPDYNHLVFGATQGAASGYNTIANVSLAFYHFGTNLDLALLEARLATYMRQLDINEYRAAETALYGAEAADYFSRIRLAGSSITTDNKVAVGNFIEGCKADGIWSSIKASCLLAGPDTLAGALVPLVGPTPSNSSFSNTDYNRTAGLIGDGLTKQIRTGYLGSPELQDNISASVWGSTITSANAAYISCGRTTTGATAISRSGGSLIRCQDAVASAGAAFVTSGLHGVSRSNSLDFVHRVGGITSGPVPSISQTQNTDEWTIFNHSRSTFSYSNSRLSFYHVGNSMDLALLDARLATYMSSLT